jgi:hypothetical protein
MTTSGWLRCDASSDCADDRQGVRSDGDHVSRTTAGLTTHGLPATPVISCWTGVGPATHLVQCGSPGWLSELATSESEAALIAQGQETLTLIQAAKLSDSRPVISACWSRRDGCRTQAARVHLKSVSSAHRRRRRHLDILGNGDDFTPTPRRQLVRALREARTPGAPLGHRHRRGDKARHPWCTMVYVSCAERRQVTRDCRCSQVRQGAISHDFTRPDHADRALWGSGGRGFKSRRPDDVNMKPGNALRFPGFFAFRTYIPPAIT